MTYSIVAKDPETGDFGVAVASRFFAVGMLVPHLRGGTCAVATQAFVSPIREIEALVATPILLRHFKLYSKDKQPVAFLTWASVSDAVKAKVEAGEPLALEDWRSGENLVVVDVVSPFNPAEAFRLRFLEGE